MGVYFFVVGVRVGIVLVRDGSLYGVHYDDDGEFEFGYVAVVDFFLFFLFRLRVLCQFSSFLASFPHFHCFCFRRGKKIYLCLCNSCVV